MFRAELYPEGGHQHSRGIPKVVTIVSGEHAASNFKVEIYPENGGSMFLRNIGNQCHNPEAHNTNLHHHGNLKSHNLTD
jgi:hypothetical protein